MFDFKDPMNVTREELINAILSMMACGNNDSPLSQHVRRKLEKKNQGDLIMIYRTFYTETEEE